MNWAELDIRNFVDESDMVNDRIELHVMHRDPQKHRKTELKSVLPSSIFGSSSSSSSQHTHRSNSDTYLFTFTTR